MTYPSLAAVLIALLAISTTVEARCSSTCQDDYKRRIEADAASKRAAVEQRNRERIDITLEGVPVSPADYSGIGGSFSSRSRLQDEVDALTQRIQTLEDSQ